MRAWPFWLLTQAMIGPAAYTPVTTSPTSTIIVATTKAIFPRCILAIWKFMTYSFLLDRLLFVTNYGSTFGPIQTRLGEAYSSVTQSHAYAPANPVAQCPA